MQLTSALMQPVTVALDIAKNVFHIYGVDARGEQGPTCRPQLTRAVNGNPLLWPARGYKRASYPNQSQLRKVVIVSQHRGYAGESDES